VLEKADMRAIVQNWLLRDPQRYFSSVNCRIAKAIGLYQKLLRNGNAQRLRYFEVGYQLEFGRLLDG
jgi:hypothetical protein